MTATGTSRWNLHPHLMDSIIALGLTILITVEAASNADSGATGADKFALLFLTVPLVWRRQEPLLVFAVILTVAVHFLQYAPYTSVCAFMVAAY
jgi:hypothetical protein